MSNNNVILTSDSDTESTGSNSVDCKNTIIIVSRECHEYECTSVPPPTLQGHKPLGNLKNPSFKPNTQPDLPSSSRQPQPLAITSMKTTTVVVSSPPPPPKPINTTTVVPSPSAPKPTNNTTLFPSPAPPKPTNTITVFPSPPPPPKPQTTTAVPVFPSPLVPKPSNTAAVAAVVPSLPAALQINNNAVANRSNLLFGFPFFNFHGEGSSALRPYGATASNPFSGINRAQNPLGGTSSQLYGVGNNHQLYHTYLRPMGHPENHNPSQRTIDFFSQKDESTSAQRQAPRENPPNETLAEWGAMLKLGK